MGDTGCKPYTRDTSASPSTTSARTTIIAPTTTPPPLPTENFSGVGDSVVTITTPGPRVARISHQGGRNFAVKSLNAAAENADLLVNVIGSYQGNVPVDFRASQESVYLEISADGAWSIDLVPIQEIPVFDGAFSGSGDDVVRYTGGTGPAAISHDGSSNFAVHAHGSRDDLLVNEIGPYNGTVVLRGPSIVEVSADGGWSVTPG